MRFSALLFSFFVCFGLSAQVDSYAPSNTDTTLLWKISGNGLESASYLFGTIHMIPADDYFLPNHVVKAMNDTKSVAFEIDPRDMEDPAMLFRLMSRINMRNDTTLQDLLSADDYKSVTDYFEKMGMPMMLFQRMKPMFLSAMIGQDMSDLSGGLSGSKNIKSYELELTEIAKKGEKEILGLETIEFQLGLFDSIPYGVQATMLVDAINADANPEGDDQFTQMVDMYKRQAVAEMASMITEESKDAGRFEELLLTKRNANWIPAMQKLMAEQNTFFAVGAGHLGNDKGVISLLRLAGYTVEPVYE